MHVTDALQRDVEARVLRDVRATIGGDHEGLIRHHSTLARTYIEDAVRYELKVVEDVQQSVHDEFIDVTWPTCPRHRCHPLWYRDGYWCCTQDDVAVARFGELAAHHASPGR